MKAERVQLEVDKNLKSRECGKGIYERKDGKYSARYTYAARAIEAGIQPKILQQLPGHAGIKTTMDRYVHVTNESLVNAVQFMPKLNEKWRTGARQNAGNR